MIKKIVVAFFIVFAVYQAHASGLVMAYAISNYGNVSISFPAGAERAIHAEMVGKYAEMLAKELVYPMKILIAFDHYSPDYYGIDQRLMVNYSVGKWFWHDDEVFTIKPILKISNSADRVDIVDVLKLLEYAILNIDEIVLKQKKVILERAYRDPIETYTLTDAQIANIINRPISKMLGKVLSKRLYRNDFTDQYRCLNYFLQNGKFYLCRTEKDKDPYIIKVFDHIWELLDIKYADHDVATAAILFDSPNTFRYLKPEKYLYSGKVSHFVSRQHSIGDTKITEVSCFVRQLGRELVSIVLRRRAREYSKDRTMIYVVPRDALILDLEELLNENLPKNTLPELDYSSW